MHADNIHCPNALVFCINGEIVEVERAKAEARLPYDIMDPNKQPLMQSVLAAQGRKVDYLTPMTSDMLIADIGGRVLENVNKNTVNMVAAALGGKPVFCPTDPNEDGILR